KPNTILTVSDHRIKLKGRAEALQQMPVDVFFRSLVAEYGSSTIGVVLSGSASDGTLGLKAIKSEGGITFAQKPETAGFDGMPRSAIAAGCVDFALPPAGIAQELVRISRHPYVTRPPDMPEDAAAGEWDRDFSEIFAILRNNTGVDFSFC